MNDEQNQGSGATRREALEDLGKIGAITGVPSLVYGAAHANKEGKFDDYTRFEMEQGDTLGYESESGADVEVTLENVQGDTATLGIEREGSYEKVQSPEQNAVDTQRVFEEEYCTSSVPLFTAVRSLLNSECEGTSYDNAEIRVRDTEDGYAEVEVDSELNPEMLE